jgi:hypothetical protein
MALILLVLMDSQIAQLYNMRYAGLGSMGFWEANRELGCWRLQLIDSIRFILTRL